MQRFLLSARQSGLVVTYSWDLKASCGRARMGVAEAHDRLQVKGLGNPIEGKTAEVEISGVSGKLFDIVLVDLQGRQLHQHTILEAGPMERVSIPVSTKGMFLLTIRTATERQHVKLLKHY
ncbi:T9SS type A sorting domain-containing protein [Spirosoma aureum]|uniref:T9SS type A sorting domain-containing protein n=1 Tax=Spirosoma aureum TaxID=2692134 RepID=A0A6G9AQB4_9BACT|nr:T9SS type A sorting domain-containing protein [Spirosoma aureum]QIP14465.1 T9SS type A sorting domain-containing protein [Spirosoma aureum]